MSTKIVDFEKYCKTCKFETSKETEDPCDDCLYIPAREDSHKPEFYKEKELAK